MKAIYKQVGRDPRQMVIPNELGVLQSLVGGYIETATLCSDLVLICDEEGLIKKKPFNCNVMSYPFYGDLILVGIDGDQFADCPLTVEKAKEMRWFG